jgi:hypothetical protein
VVIYDARFPVLEIVPGFGLYTAEGVIAALEVKSKLDTRSLEIALENSFSVSNIEVRSNRQDVRDATLQLMPLGRSYSHADIPYDDVLRRISPQTYIFAFNCSLSDQRLAECVEKWWKSKDIPFSKYRTRLPGVIVAGEKVGLSFDRVLDIEPSADARHECVTQHGEDTCIAMGIWKTKRRFGWLAMHMLRACCSRIGQIHADLDVRLDVASYLPAKQYFDSELKDSAGRLFGWRDQGKADDQ